MDTFLKKFRLTEYLAAGWVLFFVVVYAIYGQYRNTQVLADFTWRPPYLICFFLFFLRFFFPLTLLSVKKLRQVAIAFLSAVPPDWDDETLVQAIGFDQEKSILKDMLGLFRDCAPFFLFMLFYPTTEFLAQTIYGPATRDGWLIQLDWWLFRVHLTVWMERFIRPGLTDLLSMCYGMHLMVMVSVPAFLYLRDKRSLFHQAMQALMLNCIVGFILYMLVPGIGPEYTLAHLYTKNLDGGLLTQLNQAMIDNLRIPRDVFPSLHVGLSTLMLVYAWRGSKWFALGLLPFVVGNWISTIYLRYHYTVDVIAGFLLVPMVIAFVDWWNRKPGRQEPV
ncbi:MAG: phosphatase PAP2 family protein [Blastocatellia bacterium]|nr:phosphatase PAP2 family protein [Blastocatellia bacterium]